MKLRMLLAGLLFSLTGLCQAQTMGAPMCGMMGYGMMDYGMYCNMLTVTATAGGKVSSAPAGINCPGMCSKGYTMGSITLTATALPGYTFTGWDGDCSGSAACTVSMNDMRVVIAAFAATSPPVVPETGFWYNQAEGGRGYVIEAHTNGNLFIGGFMYDTNGNALWYASGPAAMSGSTYTGQWQQYGGGQTLTGAFKASGLSNPAVGAITVQFQTATTATLTLPDGRQISLVRFPF